MWFAKKSSLGMAAVMLAGMLGVFSPSTARAGIDPDAVKKAEKFVETKDVGESVCNFLHMGFKYNGRSVDRDTMVKEVTRDGKVVPGEFALVYTFKWDDDDDGRTEVAFFFDKDGTLNDVVAESTNAGPFNQPFALADVAIQAIGEILLKAGDDKLTDDQKANIQKLIDNADSRQLLIFALKLKQATE